MANLQLLSATRRIVCLATCLIALGSVAPPAQAQSYPNHVIRIIQGFAPGGAADTLSRIMADGMSKRLGQTIIVEAKPGAGGNIASEVVAKSTPDGYTLGLHHRRSRHLGRAVQIAAVPAGRQL